MTASLTRPAPRPAPHPAAAPELHSGDRLTQPEFHWRYAAAPEDFKAELIGGVVYVASPTRLPHGGVTLRLAGALAIYEANTPGVAGADNVTTILGESSEPQPDLCLRLLPEYGGQSAENAGQYLVGPPELVIEVAHSTAAIDLHDKREDYRRAGVREYLVVCISPGELRAFDLGAGREVPAGADGVYRSLAFPGLWVDVAAALGGGTARLLDVLRQGLASPEHRAFLKRLRAAAPKPPGKRKAPRRKPR